MREDPHFVSAPEPEAEAGAQAGVTLVELLVAMAILSLIALFAFQGIASLRFAAPLTTRMTEAEERAAVASHLRRTLKEAIAASPDGTPLRFDGTATTMRFTAPADPLLESGGWATITLYVETAADGTLALAERRQPSRRAPDEARDTTRLLAPVAGVRFSYASLGADGVPHWRDAWGESEDVPPGLVRIEVERPSATAARAVSRLDLFVHPIAGANPVDANKDTQKPSRTKATQVLHTNSDLPLRQPRSNLQP